MSKKAFWSLVVAVCATLASISVVLGQAGGPTPIYLDPKQPIEARVDDLLSRMTVKEKVGQLNMPYLRRQTAAEQSKLFTTGNDAQGIGPAEGFFALANVAMHDGARQQAEGYNALQKLAQTTRLKIPLMNDEEGTHGAMFPGATVFPEGLSLGSTFDLDLTKDIYSVDATEARY